MIKDIQEKCAAVNRVVEDFVDHYELDDGEINHVPDDNERLLISDAINGLLVDDGFLKVFDEWRDLANKGI